MALVVGENSYVTIEEAQSIVDNELYSDSSESILWESLSDKDKELICKKGTMAINSLEFIGHRLVWKNKLKFPRVIDGIEQIPDEIKMAAVINGLMDKVATSSEQYKLIDKGIKSMSVGPNSVSFDTSKFSGLNGTRVYDDAKVLIRKYLVTSVYS